MNINRATVKVALISCVLFGGVNTVSADTPNSNITNSLKMADLVFKGTVFNIEYRRSLPQGKTDEGSPYTFVTYEIEEVLKGNYTQRSITLRFLGGLLGKGDEFALVSHQPLFDIGDQDILLVKGNTRQSCPLVGCSHGRFRMIGGVMVNEEGMVLNIDSEGNLAGGHHLDLDEVNSHRMSGTIKLQRTVVAGPGEQSPATIGLTDLEPGQYQDPDTFTSSLEQTIQQQLTREDLDNSPKVISADIDQPFESSLQLAAQPPEDPWQQNVPPSRQQQMHEEKREAAENSALRNQPPSLSTNPDHPVQHKNPLLEEPAPPRRERGPGAEPSPPNTGHDTGLPMIRYLAGLGLLLLAGYLFFRRRKSRSC